jgi:TRAP-type C4-dicarboxylate transport system substrate-binding protein
MTTIISMKPIVIKLGGYQKPASVHNQAAGLFGEILKQRLGGRVEFQLIGDVLELGRKSGDLLPMVEHGELSLCYHSTVRLTKTIPEFRLLELPFVVKDRNIVNRALDAGLGDFLKQRVRAATPFRILAFWDNGIRHLSNSVRAIHTPADCRGIRIRTQMSELHGEAFRALGFQPIPTDIKDFVEGIASGQFQAQDNPLTNIYNFGIHKHHRYITLSGHFFGASALSCNEAHFSSWPPDVQAVVEAAAREATVLQRRLAAAEDTEVLNKLNPRDNEVIHLSAAERAAFIDAVQPVLAKYRQELDPKLFAYLE